MSDKIEELPRDLRSLCGGSVEDPDGTSRILLDPINAYASVTEVRKELERVISDPDTPTEHLASLNKQLEFVKQEQTDMERRILDHPFERPDMSDGKTKTSASNCIEVDSGAKRKVEKAIADVKAGRFDRDKISKTLQAVYKAWAFSRTNGRMPSHAELKDLGFNDQQATDAGKWFKMHAGPNKKKESLFLPLHNKAEKNSHKK